MKSKITLFGLRFEGILTSFNGSTHVAHSRWLVDNKDEAERRIPEYREYMLNLLETAWGGFYSVEADTVKISVVDYIYNPSQ